MAWWYRRPHIPKCLFFSCVYSISGGIFGQPPGLVGFLRPPEKFFHKTAENSSSSSSRQAERIYKEYVYEESFRARSMPLCVSFFFLSAGIIIIFIIIVAVVKEAVNSTSLTRVINANKVQQRRKIFFIFWFFVFVFSVEYYATGVWISLVWDKCQNKIKMFERRKCQLNF